MWRLAIVSLAAASLHASAQQSESPAGTSGPLLAAVKRLSATASLLQANEIDLRECESAKGTPGLVQADFNGDGLEDAAVLLKTRVSREVKGSPGEQYREANLLFAIFL